MRTAELDYDLPDERIARRPLAARDDSRLLVLESEGVSHTAIREWPELLEPGSLVVLNDSKVIKARLLGKRATSGGRVEILLLRSLGDGAEWEALGKANRPLREGAVVDCGGLSVTVVGRMEEGILRVALHAEGEVNDALERVGRVPIPPYLRREDDHDDVSRYQTVYARDPGSVAAPTAGLHLTAPLLKALEHREVRVERVTLHVGMGTFRPVSVTDLDDHAMHVESYSITARTVDAIAAARRRGAPVVAVGTTVVRALESAATPDGTVRAGSGETRLLIQPGYRFQVVDALLTNFHQPRSTLLALVGAFAGLDRIRAAYRVALAERYRFLSYGDAMWIPQRA